MWTNPPDSVEGLHGFVYLITNETNGRKYIGCKKFWSKRTLPPLKGKVRKRKKIVESDWMKYTGSSNSLNEDIEAGHTLKKEILRICYSQWELKYYELKLQMENDVLFRDDYYNGIVNVRLTKAPKLLLEKYEQAKDPES